jgi:hypothetical protein
MIDTTSEALSEQRQKVHNANTRLLEEGVYGGTEWINDDCSTSTEIGLLF